MSVVYDDDDIDDATPIIEGVRTLRLSAAVADSTDPFAASASEIRLYEGTSPLFKRRVTAGLNKYHRSSTGLESKRIDEDYTGYDAFDVVSPKYNLEWLAKVYDMSSAHYAAVNAKVSNIVGLGFKLVETSKTKRALEGIESNEAKAKRVRWRLSVHRDELLDTIDSFNAEDEFVETLTKVWRDYESTGNGFIEIGRNADNTVGYVGHITSHTMRVRRKRDGFVQLVNNKAQFFRHFGALETPNPVGSGTPNEVIHIKKYSPNSSYYGVPDVIAAMHAITGNEFSSRFNLDYFENKAVPRHVIVLKGARLGASSETALLRFFETNLKNQNHRSLFIPLPADTDTNKVDLKIIPVENGVQDSSFNNYRKGNREEILMAHRVPVTKVSVGEGVNLAVARDADKTFKEQVCGPEQKIFEKKINRLIKTLTDAFELKLNETTLTDADTQSKIDERDAKIGKVTRNELRARDGMPRIPGGDEIIDISKDKQQMSEETTVRQRDSERSAGATDSAGEGRNAKGDGRSAP